MPAAQVELSVVLITKNQALTVGRLIESVLAETTKLGGAEIVLVDSASEDATLDIAKRFPIRILRLRSDQRLTAAAGRYVGFHTTAGRLVLFLDGDMELGVGWLTRAVEAIEADETIGGVTGMLVYVDLVGASPQPATNPDSLGAAISDLPWIAGGVALYRREAMDRSGTFNPALYSDEEPELGLRLRRAGYRSVRVETVAAYHYGDARRTLSSLLARRRRHLFLGYGQIFRLLLGTRLLWPYLRWRGYGLLPILFLSVGLALLILLIVAHMWVGFAGWAVLLGLIVVADAVRKRSLYRACYSLLNRLFIVEGMLRGFWLPSVRSRDPLAQVDVVS
jgi:glycosyltransferase involved in cell wall biosynthesis